MRKLKVILPAVALVLTLGSVFFTTGCKKTTTYVTKDSVYYSKWMTLSMTLNVSTNGDSLYYQDITAKALTASVLRSGAVISYVAEASSGDTTALPASELGIQELLNVGNIEVQSYIGDQSGLLYRYVIIPSNVLTTTFKGFSQQQLSKMSFTEIQKAVSAGAASGQGNTLH